MHDNRSTDSNPLAGSLEARLRALPQPRVPADLERRLLAAIPAAQPLARADRPAARAYRSASPWRWLAAAGVCGMLAAACLLIALALPRGDATRSVAKTDQPRHSAGQTNAAAAPAGNRMRPFFDASKPPKFAWPLAGAPSLTAASRLRAVSFD
ncbi:MAG TPA: hypothetical protein VJ783_11960 [Pirellulales bacterium]|nr:hypothetical protein [Pirellulales bacterium]